MEKNAVKTERAPTLQEGWRWAGRCRNPGSAAEAIFADGLIRAIGGSLEAGDLLELGINRVLVPTQVGTYDIYVPIE